MKTQVLTKLASILSLFLIAGFTLFRIDKIPKVWDMKKLHAMHLPLPDTSMIMEPVSEAYYYAMPERVSYKTYPFYMPGMEPEGYYERLREQQPEIIFDPAVLKTEADWIRAGETIYDMPQTFQIMDSAFITSLPALAKHWKGFELPTTKDGIIPFLSIVVREKGRIEMGTLSCGMCHSKVMPDGSVLKGGQGNFAFPKFIVADYRVQRDFWKVPDSLLNVRRNANNRFLFAAPWIKHESQERLQQLSLDEWMEAFETPAGTVNRQGSGLGYPISIPDLFNLEDRKYLDHTGQLMHQEIGDLMRYATLNQVADGLHDYKGFTPFPKASDPEKGLVTRFTDEQLFALAKYLYTLKSPQNPHVYPESLLRKGEAVFKEQGCVTCHTPPLYTNNQLTPVDGFEPPADHFEKYDIFDISVETDPTNALYTRRGTGYYKVPSLIGVWNRTALMHNGNLANLEDLFDLKRLQPDYVPTYYKPVWLQQMAVPGHPFGMELNTGDKEAMLAYLRSL